MPVFFRINCCRRIANLQESRIQNLISSQDLLDIIMHTIYLSMMVQVIILFSFVVIGFFMRRKSILPDSTARVLSVLETHLFLPALSFKNLSANFRREMLGQNLLLVLVGVILLIMTLATGYLLSKKFSRQTRIPRNFLFYIFTFPNYGYFGYPVINAVFGEAVLFKTMMLAIPISIAIYSIGVCAINGNSSEMKDKSCRDANSNRQGLPAFILEMAKRPGRNIPPVLVTLALGILWGAARLPMPVAMSEGVSMLATCMGPVAMLLTGVVLAGYAPGMLFVSLRSYIISLVRLLAIPLLFGIVLWSAGLRKEYFMIPIIISAMPVGLNIIIFSEAAGRDSREFARICFISYFLSMFTIPLVFMCLVYLTKSQALLGI